MYKSYYDHMLSFLPEEIFEGLLGYGMFSDNLPPFLQSVDFYNWTLSQHDSLFVAKEETIPEQYENIRSINVPRLISIPHPIAYRNLCNCLQLNWNSLLSHFEINTADNTWKVSRIHIRKVKEYKKIFTLSDYDTPKIVIKEIEKDNLFDMNFSNYKEDDDPILEFKIGSRFQVHADISNFFGSIYTHSLTWAIRGKSKAKSKRNGFWDNKLDTLVMNTNNGETHGILIGSHAYNLISEIILVVIDNTLINKGYKFIRHIDDYSCLTKSFEEAESFLTTLSNELRKYGLSLNSKKIFIDELPSTADKDWVIKIFKHPASSSEYLNYLDMVSYLDFLIILLKTNDNNTAILKYGIKIITSKNSSKNAITYLTKTLHHLVLLYPYLISMFEEQIFNKYNIDKNTIKEISEDILNQGTVRYNYELISYSIYFALRYNFSFKESTPLIDKIGSLDDSISLLLAYLYDKKNADLGSNIIHQYEQIAYFLYNQKENDYWLFCYEVLSKNMLSNYWVKMKKDDISFLKSSFNNKGKKPTPQPLPKTHLRPPL